MPANGGQRTMQLCKLPGLVSHACLGKNPIGGQHRGNDVTNARCSDISEKYRRNSQTPLPCYSRQLSECRVLTRIEASKAKRCVEGENGITGNIKKLSQTIRVPGDGGGGVVIVPDSLTGRTVSCHEESEF